MRGLSGVFITVTVYGVGGVWDPLSFSEKLFSPFCGGVNLPLRVV